MTHTQLLTFADIGIIRSSVWMLIEIRFTFLTMSAHCMVLTVIADSTRNLSRLLVHSRIEVALGRVQIAVAFCCVCVCGKERITVSLMKKKQDENFAHLYKMPCCPCVPVSTADPDVTPNISHS